MDCRILRSLTLKSDGHLCCDDSSGYTLHLGEVSAKPAWSIHEVTRGPIWRHIRQSFREGRVPWPGTCEGCDLLSPGAEPLDSLDSSMELRIEPTLSCELRCPCCTRQHETKRRMGSWLLDPAVFESLLRSCVKSGIEIPRIVYLGLGEPLEHPGFADLCDIASRIVPDAIQEVGTNGNQPFRESVRSARLDRIIVAGDGVRQSSYAKYRVRGNVELALQFMRDARAYAVNKPFIEWKYILFEFNDSDEEIVEAQRLAEEIGVDSIMFIVTPSKWHSRRFRSDNLNHFPCVSPIATVSPAAGLQKVQFTGRPVSESAVMGEREAAICFIDSCVLLTCGVLRVEGWALASDGSFASRVDLFVNGSRICSQRAVHIRKDVPRVIQNAEGPACGFVFQYPWSSDWPRTSETENELDIEIGVQVNGTVEKFYCSYVFPKVNPTPAAPLVPLENEPEILGPAHDLVILSPASGKG